jgi:hypothetical protein
VRVQVPPPAPRPEEGWLIKRAFIAALAVLVAVHPAYADVACVQRELVRIGFDPGPIDDALGRKTLAAANTVRRFGGLYLPDLSVATSDLWCEALLKQEPARAAGGDQLSLNTLPGNSGATTDGALAATPILGVTREYEVPAWVNNPH